MTMGCVYPKIGTFLLAVAAVMTLPLRSPAQEPPSLTDSIDDQLLQGLDNELLRELDDVPAVNPNQADGLNKQPTATDNNPQTQPRADSELDRDSANKDSPEAELDDQHPFEQIVQRMRVIEKRLATHDTSQPTQQMQNTVVEELATLISQLEQQQREQSQSQAGGSSGAGRRPDGQPVAETSDNTEPREAIDAAGVERRVILKEVWGHLPPKVREQMMSVSPEEFLPRYRALTEQYFKRLIHE